MTDFKQYPAQAVPGLFEAAALVGQDQFVGVLDFLLQPKSVEWSDSRPSYG